MVKRALIAPARRHCVILGPQPLAIPGPQPLAILGAQPLAILGPQPLAILGPQPLDSRRALARTFRR
jgi:hypothetical protein